MKASYFIFLLFLPKDLQLSYFSQQYNCGLEAEREQDTICALFLTQSLWKPHLSEPYQE